MSAWFVLAAALLVLAALAFVLAPLLRRKSLAPRESGLGEDRIRLQALENARASGVLTDAEYQAKRAALLAADRPATPTSGTPSAAASPARRSAVLLVLLVPLATWLLYREVGEPRALQPGADAPVATAAPAAGEQPQSLDAAAASLAERMRSSPDDLGGWMLLGRAYKTLQRFPEAKEALANAYRLAPDNPDVQVEYSEALTLASDGRRIEGEAAALLDRALATEPDHQRGLWMKGIQAYQDQAFAEAASTWQRLRNLLPPDAEVGASLDERITDARARAGLPVAAAGAAGAAATGAAPNTTASAPPAGDAAASGATLTVEVDIAPALRARLQPSDVLFVFARAPSGPRMPLAIQRLPAAELPVTVTLDDTTSMTPQFTLSTLPEVVVGARVSHSGNAAPQPGDLEAFTDPVSTSSGGSIRLVIDRVVE